MTKNQAIAILTEAGYRVALVKGCRGRTGTGYRVTGHGYTNQVTLGRLREMAAILVEGETFAAG